MANFVQKTAELFADNASSITPSLSGASAGNFVALLVSCSQNGSATALTNPVGWLTAVSSTGPGSGTFRQLSAHFYKENISGGSHNGTVTFTAGSYAAANIVEFSGTKTSSSLESTNTNSGAGVTSGSTNSASNITANALVLASICLSNDSGSTSSLSSPASVGYTNIDVEPSDSTHTAYEFSYKIISAVGAQSASWSWTTAGGFGAAISIFADAGAPPSSTLWSQSCL